MSKLDNQHIMLDNETIKPIREMTLNELIEANTRLTAFCYELKHERDATMEDRVYRDCTIIRRHLTRKIKQLLAQPN
jgi:hypothetical protein